MELKSEEEMMTKLSKDCVTLLHASPFFGHILVGITKTFNNKLRATAWVQVGTHVLLSVHPEMYFAVKEDQHRVGILEHELHHIILKHHLRGREMTNHLKANVAADLAVNPMIGRDKLPEWSLWPEMFDLPEGETFEWYYDNIPEPPQSGQSDEDDDKSKGGGQGQGQSDDDDQDGDFGGSGDDDQDGGGGEQEQNPYCPPGKRPIDDHDWQSSIPEGMEAMYEVTVDRLIKSAERSCGDMPGYIKELVHYREGHIVPWQTIVRRFFGSTRALLDYTKKRRSKRYKTVPGTKFKERATIVFGVDSSGSISDFELDTFLTEVNAAHKTGLVDIWVVICDADIHQVIHPYRKIGMVEGRGGTDFRPVFDWALDTGKHPPVDGIIYLTDGYGPAPERRSKIPTLWVVTDDGQFPANWGQKLKLPALEG